MDMLATSLLDTWFADALEGPREATARNKVWFQADPQFDAMLRERYGDLPERILAGEFDDWKLAPRSALARILALDQIPRNIHRGTARAFAFDAQAREAAAEAVERGHDLALHPLESIFVYLPFEHAEDAATQARSVACFGELLARAPANQIGIFEGCLDYAHRHAEVIRRFGRFPHRNEMLGRPCTAEEAAYLRDGGQRF